MEGNEQLKQLLNNVELSESRDIINKIIGSAPENIRELSEEDKDTIEEILDIEEGIAELEQKTYEAAAEALEGYIDEINQAQNNLEGQLNSIEADVTKVIEAAEPQDLNNDQN